MNSVKIMVLIYIVLSSSCQNSNTAFVKEYMTNYRSIQNKKIKFPRSLVPYSDRISSDTSWTTGGKIIFIGNVECNTCILDLKKIEAFTAQNSEIAKTSKIIYIGYGSPTEYFDYQYKLNKFSFTILIDKKSEFLSVNELQDYNKPTLLLDDSDKLISIGSPLKPGALQNAYKHLITGQ
ncbi:hypothetical protein [Pelobium manganitolerans]|uniref:hypothetical protein n=1 Tax=Pelobium manganitolerans TaxID=1842495 RepID=UPI003FA3BE9A